jgi:hypothetical protein
MRRPDTNRANSHRAKSGGSNPHFPRLLRRDVVLYQSSDWKTKRVGDPEPPFRFDSSFSKPNLALEKRAYALGRELQELSYS